MPQVVGCESSLDKIKVLVEKGYRYNCQLVAGWERASPSLLFFARILSSFRSLDIKLAEGHRLEERSSPRRTSLEAIQPSQAHHQSINQLISRTNHNL